MTRILQINLSNLLLTHESTGSIFYILFFYPNIKSQNIYKKKPNRSLYICLKDLIRTRVEKLILMSWDRHLRVQYLLSRPLFWICWYPSLIKLEGIKNKAIEYDNINLACFSWSCVQSPFVFSLINDFFFVGLVWECLCLTSAEHL